MIVITVHADERTEAEVSIDSIQNTSRDHKLCPYHRSAVLIAHGHDDLCSAVFDTHIVLAECTVRSSQMCSSAFDCLLPVALTG